MSRTDLSECRRFLAARVEGPVRGGLMPAWFYILPLRSKKTYCGSTKWKESRYRAHFSGTGCRTTQLDPPLAVVYEEEFKTFREAFRREHQVKGWTRAKKEALIRGDLNRLKSLAKRRTK